MEKSKTSSVAATRRFVWVLATGTLLSVAVSGAAYADSGRLDAKLAMERAQTSIDMVSKENPGATQDQSFAVAHQKLADAQIAFDRHDDRQAIWLADEAELQADTTAGAAKLAGLEHTRSDVAHDVDVLELELRK